MDDGAFEQVSRQTPFSRVSTPFHLEQRRSRTSEELRTNGGRPLGVKSPTKRGQFLVCQFLVCASSSSYPDGHIDDLAAQVGNVLADVFGTELVCRTVEILRQLHADVVRAWLRAPVA